MKKMKMLPTRKESTNTFYPEKKSISISGHFPTTKSVKPTNANKEFVQSATNILNPTKWKPTTSPWHEGRKQHSTTAKCSAKTVTATNPASNYLINQ